LCRTHYSKSVAYHYDRFLEESRALITAMLM
jgi:hypothetical protein